MREMMMNLYPAIDIKFGRVVRLTRGAFDCETQYHDVPRGTGKGVRVFGMLVASCGGFGRRNTRANESIAMSLGILFRQLEMNVQLGGGIRSARLMLCIG